MGTTDLGPASRRTRLAVLVQKAPNTAPNQRFRIEQWASHLTREHGMDVEFHPFESEELAEILYTRGNLSRKARAVARDAWRRWRSRHALLGSDAVVVLREASMVGGAWLESWIARHGKPLVYDFDDAIWEPGISTSNGLLSLARMPWKVSKICRIATAVTVGNEYLAAFARRRNRSVHIVRTSIDVERFRVAAEFEAARPFTIVWTGSHSTLAHLEHVRGALERLGELVPTVLRVICDRPPMPFRAVKVEFIPWRAASEPEDLAPSHVGIMPLPDTSFARGKCGCKALQYMAIGRPVIVSPVGINTEIVADGRNGLVARSDADWTAQLLRLARDRELRQRLGSAGRATVEQSFSSRVASAAFARVARGAITKGVA